mmetsp:Transcript_11123/g.40771  ORF Transcript_11123/g.40771 Transcript_11123/m.40771 type:complete len:180 (-) Transcript_11123:308-847(-)|eukprot:scaffold2565_cov384-Prasinococcus_capsulatus_cf.AAC.2
MDYTDRDPKKRLHDDSSEISRRFREVRTPADLSTCFGDLGFKKRRRSAELAPDYQASLSGGWRGCPEEGSKAGPPSPQLSPEGLQLFVPGSSSARKVGNVVDARLEELVRESRRMAYLQSDEYRRDLVRAGSDEPKHTTGQRIPSAEQWGAGPEVGFPGQQPKHSHGRPGCGWAEMDLD